MTDSKHEALKKKLEEIKSKLLSELKNESSIPINRAEGSFRHLRPSYSAREIQKGLREVPFLDALFERRVQDWVDEDEEIKEKLLKGTKMEPSGRGKALP
jgi:hypothetical protein